MRYFRFEFEEPEIHLFPFVCWHIGAKQSSEKFIAEVVRRVKDDPLARWLYLGDGGECVTKTSKGNIYEQLLNPGDQLRVNANILSPIRDKGLAFWRGNHGNRVDRDSGLGWDETLAARVGLPYLGVSALGDLILDTGSEHPLIVSLYAHHGSASAVTPGGKNMAAHKPASHFLADIVLTAHTHMCGESDPPHVYAATNPRARRIDWKKSRCFVCGSAYDSRSGYAEEKIYSPMIPAHLAITIRKKWIPNERGAGTILIPEISHQKIEAYGDEFTNDGELIKWAGKEPLEPFETPDKVILRLAGIGGGNAEL